MSDKCQEFKAICFFLLFKIILSNSQSYIRRKWWGREEERELEGSEGDGY